MSNYKLVSPRDFIGETLIEFGGENEKIVVIDSDLSSSVTTNKFAEKFQVIASMTSIVIPEILNAGKLLDAE